MNTRGVSCIEYLNVLDVLFFILPRRFWQLLSRPCQEAEVWFIKATKPSLLILRFLAPLLKLKFLPWVFRIIDARDSGGNLLNIRVFYGDSNAIGQYLLDEDGIRRIFSQHDLLYPRLGAFLNKQVFSVDLYDDNALWKKLLLIQVFYWDCERRHLGDINKEVLIHRCFGLHAVRAYAQRLTIAIGVISVSMLTPRQIISRLWGEHKAVYMYHFYKKFGLAGIAKSIVSGCSKRHSSYQPSRMFVEYYGQLNLDKPFLYSELFFWPYSAIAASDVVLSFNVHTDPFDTHKEAQLKQFGINALVTHPEATLLTDAPSFYYWPNNFKMPLPRIMASTFDQAWIYRQHANYAQQFDYWQHLFKQHNIGLHMSWFKYGSRHCVIADAMQSLGGITLMYQRALEDISSVGTMTHVDVFFGYSARQAFIERSQGSRIPYYVITGYVGDFRFELLKPHAMQLRDQITRNGATKVMAYFDENSHDDHWNTGHQFTQENYAFLLEKVIKEPWFGLILKPKVPITLRKRLGRIHDLLVQAEETGRCIVCGEGNQGSSYPPALAALASDIAVHGHLCAATAGVEAALAGVPTLLLDREGWRQSSLYDLGEGNVVFRSWEPLWESCLLAWNNQGKNRPLGDWSRSIDTFDPFRDGKAAHRIGTYVGWLSAGLRSGQSREEALMEAAARYRKQWGQDKVISMT